MKKLRIAVAGGVNFADAAALTAGVADYFGNRPEVEVVPLHYSQENAVASLMSDGSIDGFIGEIVSDNWLLSLPPERRKAVINTSGLSDVSSVLSVLPDDCAIGKLAAAHFLRRGYKQLCYAGFRSYHCSQNRLLGFRKAAEEQNILVTELPHCNLNSSLRAWVDILMDIPEPPGVFCVDDFTARKIIVACREAGLRVPHDLSVIGVGNSRLDSFFAGIGISTVAIDYGAVGRQSASLLVNCLESDTVDFPASVRIPPSGIILRETTGVGALNTIVGRALNYIEKHLDEPLTVAEICRKLNVSRRLLEIRFKKALGRSPFEEITALRMARAEQLLKQPDISIADAAARCGYPETAHFYVRFKQYHAGIAPGAWRRDHFHT